MPTADALARALVARSGTLRPGSGASRHTLEAARFALARSLASGVDIEDAPDLPDDELAAALGYFQPEAAAAALTGLGVGDRFAVSRSEELELLITGEQRSVSGLKAAGRIGPLVDESGREIFFDLYVPSAELAVHIIGQARPALVMSSGRRPTVPRLVYRIDLEPGTIWILAQLLDPAAPADGYVGFRVTDGSVTLPATPTVAGGQLTLSTPGEIKLALSLAPVTAVPFEPACTVGAVTAPNELALTLGVAPSSAGVEGRCTIGATKLALHAGPGIMFDAAWNRLTFAAVAEPAKVALTGIGHRAARFDGEAAVERAAWAVPVTRPADPMALGEADPEAAGWLLYLAGTVTVQWPGSGTEPVAIQRISILASPRRLLLRSATPAPSARELRQTFGLWRLPRSDRPLPLLVRTAAPFNLSFLCDATDGEALAMTAHAELALDRPLPATGVPFAATVAEVHVLFSHRDATTRIMLAARGAPATAADTWPLALENGFFRVAAPRFRLLTGTLEDDEVVVDGTLAVQLEVRGFLPTLPDPYVANVAPSREFGRDGAGGALIASVGWTADGTAQLTFGGALAPSGIGPLEPSPRSVQPAGTGGQPGPQQTLATERDRDLAVARRIFNATTGQRVEAGRALDERQRIRLDQQATEAGLHVVGGLRLLDVSTRRHQIGVQISMGDRPNVAVAGNARLRAEGLAIVTPLAGMQVFMLPQVQWEPVATLDKDQDLTKFGYFPSPLASADDGGATLIGSSSLKLAPVVPDLVLDELIAAFAEGTRTALFTTLPFGIKAVLALRPGPGGDDIGLNEAVYAAAAPLRNALQLSLHALRHFIGPGRESPSFAGAAAQFLNGVDLVTGAPLGLSVLGSPADPKGSVEEMFNNEFPAAAPRVPVTRLDLSGYGASSFSEWANPFAAFAEASKVQFQILVGRTALEVVKFSSVFYPWGVRVTRMVTVERRGSGGVIRRDTGWQPVSNGLFDFRYKDKATGTPQPSPYTVHPGLFRGLYAVRNIRPVPGAAPIVFTSTAGGTAELLPYYFDAEAALEDGVGETRARAEGMLGFLHVRPVGEPLTAEDLTALIARQSAIGGPVDAEITIGASGLRTRALRVEVDTAGGAAPEFAASVRNVPLFGPNGAWSVVRQPGPGSASAVPDVEPVTDGAPLVREGGIRYSPGTAIADGEMLRPAAQGPYRFADAQDLFAAGAPKRDYAFLQTTPTHGFLFRRPQITAGDLRIISVLPPLFADIYARTTAQSLFPPSANAIELSDRPYVLATNPATGRFRLEPPVSLPAPRSDLLIGEGVEQAMRLVYTDTTLSLAIDEASWSLDMPRLVMWTGFPDLPELIGTRSRLSGSSTGRSQISEIDTLLTDWVDTMLSFAPGMSPRERPPVIDLAATNLKLAGKVSAVFFFERHFGVVEFKAFGTVALGGESASKPGAGDDFYVGLVIGFNIQGNIPLGGIFFLVLGVELEVGGKVFIGGASAGKGKALMEIKVYAGIGVGTTNPVIKLYGFVAGGLAIERDSKGWHFGGLGMIEAEAMVVELVKVTIGGEFIGIGKREGETTVTEYTGQVAINVKVMVFLSIKMTWALKFEQEM